MHLVIVTNMKLLTGGPGGPTSPGVPCEPGGPYTSIYMESHVESSMYMFRGVRSIDIWVWVL